jgi:NTE family protein
VKGPQRVSPGNIQYLSLAGGGGKGVTYLGAIKALELYKVLPIDIDKTDSNQIKGISGASAGAITALFLAMGATSEDIRSILSEPKDFTAFFDKPDVGLYRSVDGQNQPATKSDAPPGQRGIDFIQARLKGNRTMGLLADTFADLATSIFGIRDNLIVQKILTAPDHYLYNLLFDRGLFPGFAQRNFFARAIGIRLAKKIFEHTRGVIPSSINGGNVNFEQFSKFTGVDLVITGANVTTRRPAVFSRRHTPKFPVAEAVGISMNLPLLFKPVLVEAEVAVSNFNSDPKAYQGRWVDGGLLNNFPLHAFDYQQPPVSKDHPEYRPLHPKMLGLRLTDGPGRPRPKPSDNILKQHLSDVLETTLYPANEGQILTPQEMAQTIPLWTYDLDTTDFAPPTSASAKPIENAERVVMRYLSGTE